MLGEEPEVPDVIDQGVVTVLRAWEHVIRLDNVARVEGFATRPVLHQGQGDVVSEELVVRTLYTGLGLTGLELDTTELDTFKTLTGRQSAPDNAFAELWLAIGRRGGKSHAAAFLAVYLAAFHDYRDKLAPGEVATVKLVRYRVADLRDWMAQHRVEPGEVSE